MELIFENYGSAAAFLIFVTSSSAFINNKYGNEGWKAWLVSWGMAIPLVALGCYKEWGIFASATIVDCVLDAVLYALAANGFFSVPSVKKLAKAEEG